MQDDKGKTVQYDKRGFLVWDNAGVSAVRNEENAYNISAIYLWVTENKESVRNLPAPTGVFCGEIVVEGIRWNRKSGMAIRSGELEIMTSASEGYMESHLPIAETEGTLGNIIGMRWLKICRRRSWKGIGL